MVSFNDARRLYVETIGLNAFDAGKECSCGKVKYRKCFPTVDEFQDKKNIGLIDNEELNTLTQPQSSLPHTFPSLDIDEFAWLINPFAILEEVNLTTEEEEHLNE
ncbi:hypothetical protein Btru_075949 [Bulinus truncatus]|nr:hypothetical protein Btru_075949 [Bulinus truncatus]